MNQSLLFLTIFGILLHSVGVARAQNASTDFQRRQSEMKAQMERSKAEMKQRHERAVKEMQADQKPWGQKSPKDLHKDAKKDLRKDNESRNADRRAPPFNSTAAAPPADCLRAYIAAAKTAGSMEQLLIYLPLAQQRVLKERQAMYDPKQAEQSRQWHRKQNPSLDKESLAHLTNPAYVNELKWHKQTAGKVLEVLSVKTDGGKAFIEVSTSSGGTVNGTRYPYGKATIEMAGEGNSWKVAAYNDSNVVYLHPPTPRLNATKN